MKPEVYVFVSVNVPMGLLLQVYTSVGGWPMHKIELRHWVPHLRRGLIVAKVGYFLRRQRNPNTAGYFGNAVRIVGAQNQQRSLPDISTGTK
jgi:hypothetical protein